ncbi:hypothetical protein ACI3KX_02155 [Microbacterium sp. ZW CA_36]|uniref:hypothetical protein n=1 Tax=Microbacterium sp. ZW CA_36 TaxID=3378078 RepID=UPI003853F952
MLRAPEPDASLDPFRDGIAVLTRDGKVEGHVASTVGTFWSPSRPFTKQWWVWLTVVWSNGDRERPFEDYPPCWTTVGELKIGRFEWTDEGIHWGDYNAEWLPSEERARVRQELLISGDDF